MNKFPKQMIGLLLLISFCVFLSADIEPLGEKIAETLTRSLSFFASGDVAQGTGTLLNAVILVRPRSQWPQGFATCIESAKTHFAQGHYPEGVSAVSRALALIQTDPLPRVHLTPENPAPIAQLFRERIETARKHFAEGQADAGVITILQALQLLAPIAH